jgi:hypothetical protein
VKAGRRFFITHRIPITIEASLVETFTFLSGDFLTIEFDFLLMEAV